MKIALFQGIGVVSGAIQWETRSRYSHVAAWWPAEAGAPQGEGARPGELYEAVGAGFVCAPSLGANHDRGIVVDILGFKEPLSALEEARALVAARAMVGAPYDYEMVFAGFPLRTNFEPARDRRAFFCSESVFLICAAMGPSRVLLERTQAWRVPPEWINLSPLLGWEGSVVL